MHIFNIDISSLLDTFSQAILALEEYVVENEEAYCGHDISELRNYHATLCRLLLGFFDNILLELHCVFTVPSIRCHCS